MTWAGFVKTAYSAARDWGIQPSEFWAMSPTEWWWEADAKVRQHKAMTPGAGGFSQADWEAARKNHREKMERQT